MVKDKEGWKSKVEKVKYLSFKKPPTVTRGFFFLSLSFSLGLSLSLSSFCVWVTPPIVRWLLLPMHKPCGQAVCTGQMSTSLYNTFSLSVVTVVGLATHFGKRRILSHTHIYTRVHLETTFHIWKLTILPLGTIKQQQKGNKWLTDKFGKVAIINLQNWTTTAAVHFNWGWKSFYHTSSQRHLTLQFTIGWKFKSGFVLESTHTHIHTVTHQSIHPTYI